MLGLGGTLSPRGKIPGVHRTGGYVGPRAGMNVVTNRKYLVRDWNRTQVSRSPQPSHCKDCAILTPKGKVAPSLQHAPWSCSPVFNQTHCNTTSRSRQYQALDGTWCRSAGSLTDRTLYHRRQKPRYPACVRARRRIFSLSFLGETERGPIYQGLWEMDEGGSRSTFSLSLSLSERGTWKEGGLLYRGPWMACKGRLWRRESLSTGAPLGNLEGCSYTGYEMNGGGL